MGKWLGLLLLLCGTAHGEVLKAIAPGDADELLGHPVAIATPGKPPQPIGRVVDLLVDAAGHPVAAVLDLGGFMGVGNRKVAVTWDTLQFAPDKDGFAITLALDADKLRAAPDYKGPGKPVQAVAP